MLYLTFWTPSRIPEVNLLFNWARGRGPTERLLPPRPHMLSRGGAPWALPSAPWSARAHTQATPKTLAQVCIWRPRLPPERSKRPQERPKIPQETQRATQAPPKSPQEPPKSPARPIQEPPRATQEPPRATQNCPRELQRATQEPQRATPRTIKPPKRQTITPWSTGWLTPFKGAGGTGRQPLNPAAPLRGSRRVKTQREIFIMNF